MTGRIGHHVAMATTTARTVRERVRAEMTDEIKAVARRHLAEHGSAALSLRAVAREVGLVSSAVYRYFASRDDLLTALIVDAYDAVGAVAEATESGSARHGTAERWMALAAAVRAWARANLHEYTLIYGSPIPGYAAPEDTIAPASRVSLVLLRLVADGVESGEVTARSGGPAGPAGSPGRIPRAVRADLRALSDQVGLAIPEAVLLRALAVWAQLYGSLNLELYGHLHNVIHDFDALFETQMRQAARHLVGGGSRPGS
jgi:AcrR family transcriptional regulator